MSRLAHLLAASMLCNGLALLLIPIDLPIPITAVAALLTASLCALLWPHRLLGSSNRQLHLLLYCFTALLLLGSLRGETFAWRNEALLVPLLMSLPLLVASFVLRAEEVVRLGVFVFGAPIAVYTALIGVPVSFNRIATGEVMAITLVSLVLWRPHGFYRVLRFALAAACVAALVKASSLGPLVSASLALLLASRSRFSREERRPRRFRKTRVLLAVLAVSASVYLLSVELGGGTTVGGNNSVSRREAFDAILSSPTWFGHGFTPIPLPSGGAVPYAHNLIADIFWATGFFGLAIALVALVPLLRRFLSAPSPALIPLSVVLFQALFSSAALGNFTLWLALGLIAAEYGRGATTSSSNLPLQRINA